jgi:hypothetical protein
MRLVLIFLHLALREMPHVEFNVLKHGKVQGVLGNREDPGYGLALSSSKRSVLSTNWTLPEFIRCQPRKLQRDEYHHSEVLLNPTPNRLSLESGSLRGFS